MRNLVFPRMLRQLACSDSGSKSSILLLPATAETNVFNRSERSDTPPENWQWNLQMPLHKRKHIYKLSILGCLWNSSSSISKYSQNTSYDHITLTKKDLWQKIFWNKNTKKTQILVGGFNPLIFGVFFCVFFLFRCAYISFCWPSTGNFSVLFLAFTFWFLWNL